MKKVNLFLVMLLMCFPLASQAKQALTKELITSFSKVSQQWQSLEASYPELTASMDKMDFSQPDKLIAQLKSSKAYPKIKAMLADTDFSSIEEFYDVSMRVMGGMMAYQMQSMPQGMNVDSMNTMLRSNIEQMKASNAPSSMITEMEKQLDEMDKSMKMMKSAMENTSAEDKKFISENAQWIMSIIGDE